MIRTLSSATSFILLVLLALATAIKAGDNIGARFNMVRDNPTLDIGPGTIVPVHIAASNLVGVKKVEIVLALSPENAFDLAATSYELPTAWLWPQTRGNADLFRAELTTAADFTDQTQATVTVEKIAIGTSAPAGDEFAGVEWGLQLGLNHVLIVQDPPAPDSTAIPAAPMALVINELMADNDNVLSDPQEEYDDWVELLNTGDQALDLGGLYLSDDISEPRKWPFPAGTILPAGGYLLVWIDGDEGDDPGLHASFGLAAVGEAVLLVDADERGNALIDSVVFGPQQTDQAYGRLPDGNGPFAVLAAPTPGQPNDPLTAVLATGEKPLPTAFTLEQNYPNPFNSGTAIPFSLPAGTAAHMELEIFNLAGQRVTSLMQGTMQEGAHTVEWNGRDDLGRPLASGVYFYRLQAGPNAQTRRLLLLR